MSSSPQLGVLCHFASRCAIVQVGLVFSQSTAERDYIAHTGELLQMAAMQASLVVAHAFWWCLRAVMRDIITGRQSSTDGSHAGGGCRGHIL